MSKVTISLDIGKSGGHASFSLNILSDDLESGSGHRICGEKGWGGSRSAEQIELSVGELEDLIKCAKIYLEDLKKIGPSE